MRVIPKYLLVLVMVLSVFLGQNTVSNAVSVNSSDLELVNDGSKGNQTVGLRFNNISVPSGSQPTVLSQIDCEAH